MTTTTAQPQLSQVGERASLLLAELERQGCHLEQAGADLKLAGEVYRVTPELRAQLRKHKPALWDRWTAAMAQEGGDDAP